jgi:hypothetical protein
MLPNSITVNKTLWIEQLPPVWKERQPILQMWIWKGNSRALHIGMLKLQEAKERVKEKCRHMENED